LCRLFGFSKQAYYKRNSIDNHSFDDLVKPLIMKVRNQLPKSGGRKVYHMIRPELKSLGIKMGRDKLFDYLRSEHLLVYKRKKYHKTTNSRHWMKRYPNKVKDLVLKRPEQVWVADITYLQVKNSHHYLHLITDAYSKKIVGYALSNDLMATTTNKALSKAIKSRQYCEPLIHHSDRGLQYCSTLYTNNLIKNGIDISMTEQSDPYENAVAERVNGILKDEFGLGDTFETTRHLTNQVDQAIKLYNQLRPHMSIELMTPEQAHKQRRIKIKTWKSEYHSKLALNGIH
jgi:putative transposase